MPQDEKRKEPQPVRNITDPDSRLMHCTLRGLVQAYNCQVPRTGDGVFLLPRATQDINDTAQLTPALKAIARSQDIIAAGHAAAGRPGFWSRTGTIVFDPGYFSKDNCQGRGLYRRRAPVSEGGFAELKDTIGLRRFAMRGLPKANGELLLACTAANIGLLYRRTRPA